MGLTSPNTIPYCGLYLSAMVPRVPNMINPTRLQQLMRQRQVEAVAARARRLVPPRPGVRERLGWSLVGLGTRLALASSQRRADHWQHALSEEGVRHLAPFARP